MLEAGRVGGVSGDGNVNAFLPHDRDALADIVGSVDADGCALAFGILEFLDDFKLAGVIVELGLHIGETVNPADDLGGVLSKTVQTHLEGGRAGAVGALGDTDRAFGCGEGFVSGKEAEALGLVGKEHRGEISVSDADLAVVSD